jgi:HD superfamily phosphohydrolase
MPMPRLVADVSEMPRQGGERPSIGHWTNYLQTPAVLRLKQISQLGVLALSNPTLGYTRFAHSVGVAQFAEQLSMKLALNKHVARQFQLAALMHDTGHGALSHIFEKYSKRGTHEARSISHVKKLKLRACDEEAVIAFMKGDHPLQLLVAGDSGVDIDRIDYIIRDSVALRHTSPFTPQEALDAFSVRDGVMVISPGFALTLRHARMILYRDVYHSYETKHLEALVSPVFARLARMYGHALTENMVCIALEKAGITLSRVWFPE